MEDIIHKLQKSLPSAETTPQSDDNVTGSTTRKKSRPPKLKQQRPTSSDSATQKNENPPAETVQKEKLLPAQEAGKKSVDANAKSVSDSLKKVEVSSTEKTVVSSNKKPRTKSSKKVSKATKAESSAVSESSTKSVGSEDKTVTKPANKRTDSPAKQASKDKTTTTSNLSKERDRSVSPSKSSPSFTSIKTMEKVSSPKTANKAKSSTVENTVKSKPSSPSKTAPKTKTSSSPSKVKPSSPTKAKSTTQRGLAKSKPRQSRPKKNLESIVKDIQVRKTEVEMTSKTPVGGSDAKTEKFGHDQQKESETENTKSKSGESKEKTLGVGDTLDTKTQLEKQTKGNQPPVALETNKDGSSDKRKMTKAPSPPTLIPSDESAASSNSETAATSDLNKPSTVGVSYNTDEPLDLSKKCTTDNAERQTTSGNNSPLNLSVTPATSQPPTGDKSKQVYQVDGICDISSSSDNDSDIEFEQGSFNDQQLCSVSCANSDFSAKLCDSNRLCTTYSALCQLDGPLDNDSGEDEQQNNAQMNQNQVKNNGSVTAGQIKDTNMSTGQGKDTDVTTGSDKVKDTDVTTGQVKHTGQYKEFMDLSLSSESQVEDDNIDSERPLMDTDSTEVTQQINDPVMTETEAKDTNTTNSQEDTPKVSQNGDDILNNDQGNENMSDVHPQTVNFEGNASSSTETNSVQNDVPSLPSNTGTVNEGDSYNNLVYQLASNPIVIEPPPDDDDDDRTKQASKDEVQKNSTGNDVTPACETNSEAHDTHSDKITEEQEAVDESPSDNVQSSNGQVAEGTSSVSDLLDMFQMECEDVDGESTTVNKIIIPRVKPKPRKQTTQKENHEPDKGETESSSVLGQITTISSPESAISPKSVRGRPRGKSNTSNRSASSGKGKTNCNLCTGEDIVKKVSSTSSKTQATVATPKVVPKPKKPAAVFVDLTNDSDSDVQEVPQPPELVITNSFSCAEEQVKPAEAEPKDSSASTVDKSEDSVSASKEKETESSGDKLTSVDDVSKPEKNVNTDASKPEEKQSEAVEIVDESAKSEDKEAAVESVPPETNNAVVNPLKKVEDLLPTVTFQEDFEPPSLSTTPLPKPVEVTAVETPKKTEMYWSLPKPVAKTPPEKRMSFTDCFSAFLAKHKSENTPKMPVKSIDKQPVKSAEDASNNKTDQKKVIVISDGRYTAPRGARGGRRGGGRGRGRGRYKRESNGNLSDESSSSEDEWEDSVKARKPKVGSKNKRARRSNNDDRMDEEEMDTPNVEEEDDDSETNSLVDQKGDFIPPIVAKLKKKNSKCDSKDSSESELGPRRRSGRQTTKRVNYCVDLEPSSDSQEEEEEKAQVEEQSGSNTDQSEINQFNQDSDTEVEDSQEVDVMMPNIDVQPDLDTANANRFMEIDELVRITALRSLQEEDLSSRSQSQQSNRSRSNRQSNDDEFIISEEEDDSTGRRARTSRRRGRGGGRGRRKGRGRSLEQSVDYICAQLDGQDDSPPRSSTEKSDETSKQEKGSQDSTETDNDGKEKAGTCSNEQKEDGEKEEKKESEKLKPLNDEKPEEKFDTKESDKVIADSSVGESSNVKEASVDGKLSAEDTHDKTISTKDDVKAETVEIKDENKTEKDDKESDIGSEKRQDSSGVECKGEGDNVVKDMEIDVKIDTEKCSTNTSQTVKENKENEQVDKEITVDKKDEVMKDKQQTDQDTAKACDKTEGDKNDTKTDVKSELKNAEEGKGTAQTTEKKPKSKGKAKAKVTQLPTRKSTRRVIKVIHDDSDSESEELRKAIKESRNSAKLEQQQKVLSELKQKSEKAEVVSQSDEGVKTQDDTKDVKQEDIVMVSDSGEHSETEITTPKKVTEKRRQPAGRRQVARCRAPRTPVSRTEQTPQRKSPRKVNHSHMQSVLDRLKEEGTESGSDSVDYSERVTRGRLRGQCLNVYFIFNAGGRFRLIRSFSDSV